MPPAPGGYPRSSPRLLNIRITVGAHLAKPFLHTSRRASSAQNLSTDGEQAPAVVTVFYTCIAGYSYLFALRSSELLEHRIKVDGNCVRE